MRCWKPTRRVLPVALAACLLCTVAQAKKPVKPPGDDAAGYNLVVLAPPDVAVTDSHGADLDSLGNVVGSYSNQGSDYNGFYYDRSQGLYICWLNRVYDRPD